MISYSKQKQVHFYNTGKTNVSLKIQLKKIELQQGGKLPILKVWKWSAGAAQPAWWGQGSAPLLRTKGKPPEAESILWPLTFKLSPCGESIVDRFSFFLFIQRYSLLLSRLTALTCDSTWVSSFYSVFLNIHQSGVLTALTWLVSHKTAAVLAHSEYTMSLRAKPHTYGACVFSCNQPPALLAEWPGTFACYCGNMEWNGYQNKSQHRKLTLEKKILPLLPTPLCFFKSAIRMHRNAEFFLHVRFLCQKNVCTKTKLPFLWK